MCGRLVISRYGANLSQMRNYANQIMNNLNSFRAGYNIAPGDYIPGIFLQENQSNQPSDTISNGNNKNSISSKKIKELPKNTNFNEKEKIPRSNLYLESMKWGINTGRDNILLFNSRSDTINLFPFYKKYKRCIIIIEGYYEWKKNNKK